MAGMQHSSTATYRTGARAGLNNETKIRSSHAILAKGHGVSPMMSTEASMIRKREGKIVVMVYGLFKFDTEVRHAR